MSKSFILQPKKAMQKLMLRLRNGEVCRYDQMEMVDDGFKGFVLTGKVLVFTTDPLGNIYRKVIDVTEIIERFYVDE